MLLLTGLNSALYCEKQSGLYRDNNLKLIICMIINIYIFICSLLNQKSEKFVLIVNVYSISGLLQSETSWWKWWGVLCWYYQRWNHPIESSKSKQKNHFLTIWFVLGLICLYRYSIFICYLQFVVILTGLNSAICCKSRAGYTEIGNKKDYISCCDFHLIMLLSDHQTTIMCYLFIFDLFIYLLQGSRASNKIENVSNLLTTISNACYFLLYLLSSELSFSVLNFS